MTELDTKTVIPPKLHHVNLLTTRLDEMIEWYGKVIGAKPNFRNEMLAFLSNDDANHRIAIGGFPGLTDDPEKDQHTRMHHTAFEFSEIDELLGTFLRLKGEGIEPAMCIDHGLTLSYYYADPDGNQVELQIDNYGDWAKSTEYIRDSTEFKDNPIGAFVDPEAQIEARRAGASTWEIHERSMAGEFPGAAVTM